MRDIIDRFNGKTNKAKLALRGISSKEGNAADPEDYFDYHSGKVRYLKSNLTNALDSLQREAWNLVELKDVHKGNEKIILQILTTISEINENTDKSKLPKILEKIEELSAGLTVGAGREKTPLFTELPEIPEAVRADMVADLNEIRKSFEAGCNRAGVVMCGRVLETALLRKYYEATGTDLMETSPGIGLGKIIAKLTERNIRFDPGLTQQIHLINQVRISSVHTKKDSFYPSKGQTQAMILYTLDVLRKLFA
ncbi:MAG: hypothetical protein CL963_01130 [Euryarchaeota archaeon]|jgi:hypothetical protein|nr:hypothetical protein [Euryarchaeota archaeon]HIK01293.1 hypothetical protein [Candidatus Undinarchaeales archaeon ERR594346 U_76725]|tara:strand:+ start:41092 stop:41850 length:759 start_codon:yes stop_codon:yes gene_type:complete